MAYNPHAKASLYDEYVTDLRNTKNRNKRKQKVGAPREGLQQKTFGKGPTGKASNVTQASVEGSVRSNRRYESPPDNTMRHDARTEAEMKKRDATREVRQTLNYRRVKRQPDSRDIQRGPDTRGTEAAREVAATEATPDTGPSAKSLSSARVSAARKKKRRQTSRMASRR